MANGKKRIKKAKETIKVGVSKFGTKGGPKVPNLQKVSDEFLDIMQTHAPEKGGYRSQAKKEIERRKGVIRGYR